MLDLGLGCLLMFLWVRNRVVAPRIPRVAAAYPLHAHPTSFYQTKSLYRLKRIVGATGSESANGWFPLECPLISPDEANSNRDSNFLQRSILPNAAFNSACRSGILVSAPAAFTNKTKSTSSEVSLRTSRSASLHLRFTWLRLAKLPSDFTVVTATLPSPCRQISRKSGESITRPHLNISSKSLLSVNLCGLGSNFVAALGTATLDDIAPVGRSHSNPEPVRLVLVAIIRLVGTLHPIFLGRRGAKYTCLVADYHLITGKTNRRSNPRQF